MEKTGILLNAVTTLTQSGECELARKQLDLVRGLLTETKMGSLGPSDPNELLGLIVGVEVEEAEICTSEGRFEEAIKKFTTILEQYVRPLKERGLFQISDDVQMRRAFLWADIGSFEKAKSTLEELESRQCQNPFFLFYLGVCLRNGFLDPILRAKAPISGYPVQCASSNDRTASTMGIFGNILFSFRSSFSVSSSLYP